MVVVSLFSYLHLCSHAHFSRQDAASAAGRAEVDAHNVKPIMQEQQFPYHSLQSQANIAAKKKAIEAAAAGAL